MTNDDNYNMNDTDSEEFAVVEMNKTLPSDVYATGNVSHLR